MGVPFTVLPALLLGIAISSNKLMGFLNYQGGLQPVRTPGKFFFYNRWPVVIVAPWAE
jgi:hypothetical protein